jgi:hypothetical protein
VLITAEWLSERYDVDIRCYRIALAKNGAEDFLTCTRAYPPPELTDIAIRRRRKKEIGTTETVDWSEALASVENPAVAKFFRDELDGGRSGHLRDKGLRFYIGDRRRFVVLAKRGWARVWQSGRFDDDVEFWKSRLGEQGKVRPKWGGRALRFYLYDEAALKKLKHAATVELTKTEFHGGPEDGADEIEQAAE